MNLNTEAIYENGILKLDQELPLKNGQYGLLGNDALIVVSMKRYCLTHLASNDSDFDSVPGIIRYAPV